MAQFFVERLPNKRYDAFACALRCRRIPKTATAFKAHRFCSYSNALFTVNRPFFCRFIGFSPHTILPIAMPTRPKLRAVIQSALFVFSLYTACPLLAAPPKFDADKLAAIALGMKHFVDEHQIGGAVLLVGTSDGIAYLETVGTQKLATPAPMPKDAIFRIMSMTKPITALGIMVLRDEGKLSVDDPVEKYLPEFKGQMLLASKDDDTETLKKPSRPITIKDLLTHTGGVPDYPTAVNNMIRQQSHTLSEAVEITSQRPLEFEPGSKWKYSSSGIDVLGRIIEVLSGQPYEDFLKQRFFDPLDMHDTGFYLTPQQAERLADLCAVKDGQLVEAAHVARLALGESDSQAEVLQPGRRLVFHRGRLGETRSGITQRRSTERSSHHRRKHVARNDAEAVGRCKSWFCARVGLGAGIYPR